MVMFSDRRKMHDRRRATGVALGRRDIFQAAGEAQEMESAKEFESWLIRMGLSDRSNLDVSRSGIYADFN